MADEPTDRFDNGTGHFGRLMVGFALGLTASGIFYLTSGSSKTAWIGYLAIAVALLIAIRRTNQKEKSGYIAGAILAPMLVVFAILLLMLQQCGFG